jgi:succinate dehydrogenase/fumarate reductase-like Fe-S protein
MISYHGFPCVLRRLRRTLRNLRLFQRQRSQENADDDWAWDCLSNWYDTGSCPTETPPETM